MPLNYNRLWKMLIDKNINKTDLSKLTGLSHTTISKISKCENVNTNVLERLCSALNCNLDEIVEYEEEDK